MSWREYAAPIIADVLERFPNEGKEQRQALTAAYPFGERRYFPYKVWLSEIKRQRRQKAKPKLIRTTSLISEEQILLEV